ncbi:MAG TPA: hypothetical protein VMX17_16515 [Candidatus Glassbacteria bacterium]|nr:hypothetical protein [Candidatus Glassbacteria bacterium]
MTKIDLDVVLKAIDDEPELPGEMTDEIWERIRNCHLDRERFTNALRVLVSCTKDGIRDRINTQAKQEILGISEDMELTYYFIDVRGEVTKRSEGITEDDPEWNETFLGSVMYVTSASHFQSNNCCEGRIDNGVYEVLKAGGFTAGELMEGVLEFFPGNDIDALRELLTRHPKFEANEEFETFIRSFGS